MKGLTYINFDYKSSYAIMQVKPRVEDVPANEKRSVGMNNIRRIYVEKKAPYAVKTNELKMEIINYLGIKSIDRVRVLNRYDIENVSDETYKKSLGVVF